jgi:hypothetical protein
MKELLEGGGQVLQYYIYELVLSISEAAGGRSLIIYGKALGSDQDK